MGDDGLDGKPRRKGPVWFLWVASMCDWGMGQKRKGIQGGVEGDGGV